MSPIRYQEPGVVAEIVSAIGAVIGRELGRKLEQRFGTSSLPQHPSQGSTQGNLVLKGMSNEELQSLANQVIDELDNRQATA